MRNVIGIVHDATFGTLVCGVPIDDTKTWEYLKGNSKPNYPVPALRSKVQFKHHAKGRFILGLYEASNTFGLWFITHVYCVKD